MIDIFFLVGFDGFFMPAPNFAYLIPTDHLIVYPVCPTFSWTCGYILELETCSVLESTVGEGCIERDLREDRW